MQESIQEEPVAEQNRTMMGLLSQLGIQKGERFEPDAKTNEVFRAAAADALQYMSAPAAGRPGSATTGSGCAVSQAAAVPKSPGISIGGK